MGVGKEMWIAAYEKLGEDFTDGIITTDEFRTRMKGLGFDEDEISEHISTIDFPPED